MRMQIAVTISLFLLLSTNIVAAQESDALYFRHVVLDHAVEFRLPAFDKDTHEMSRPWSRRIQNEFDDFRAGTGSILVLYRGVGCDVTPGKYASSDCGAEETIVFASKSESSRRWVIRDDGAVTGVMYDGVRSAPGQTGCFGIAKQGAVVFSIATDGTLRAEVDVTFEVLDLFRYPAKCPDRHVVGKYAATTIGATPDKGRLREYVSGG